MPLTSLLLALAVAAPVAIESAPPEAPIPEKIPSPDAADDVPTVNIRVAENGDRVEEYRENGQLTMVKITPLRGPAYYLYDTDGNGRLEYDDRGPSISPVHWVVYEWD